MCGICGYVSTDPGRLQPEHVLRHMTGLIRHRGPDDDGFYFDGHAALGMRRLSIIDLVTGQQPITNEQGTLWLVFNGEIYNFQQVRRDLVRKGHVFQSEGDSETIVHAYEEYGDRLVERLNGMFAFALWDAPNRRLLAARDRLGIKPLYYWAGNGQLVFGSELKAVVSHPAVPKDVDLVALDQYLSLEYIPAPRTIYEGISKLPAGHTLVFEDGEVRTNPYWDLAPQDVPADEGACVDILRELLRDAVRMQMISDVPLGAFLSGGIDSSTVVAFMSEASSTPVQTFSIGFDDETYNELPYARIVSQRFGTQHCEEVLEPDIADLALGLLAQLDEPFGDFSIFPTYLVSRVAREHVTVVLSGDGGDEIFGGYETYAAEHMNRYYRWFPSFARRRTLPWLMDRVSPRPAKKGLVNKAKRFVEGGALPDSLQHARWMIFLNEADKQGLYTAGLKDALGGRSSTDPLEGLFERVAWAAPLAQQQYVDIKSYLAEDILTKIDRMSMAVSLEGRVPLLDHRIVEFAWNLPSAMKFRSGKSKLILRKAMEGILPAEVLSKPKQGFSIPLKHWLGGALKPLMLDLLSPASVATGGYFDPACVQGWIEAHLEGRANHSHRLWALMVFELWRRRSLDPAPADLPAERVGA